MGPKTKEVRKTKQIRDSETDFLFEWVKNWYNTDKKPKIKILLLNKKEWSDFYTSQPKQSMKEIAEKVKKELSERCPEFKEIFEKIEKLPKEDQKRLLEKLKPHNFFSGMPENADPYDYYMNEQSGVMYSHDVDKDLEKDGILPNPIWKQFPDYDFIILISDFFNEKQKELEKHRDLYIYDTIFHELIHVIEHLNRTQIFKSNNKLECEKITFPITRKWFER